MELENDSFCDDSMEFDDVLDQSYFGRNESSDEDDEEAEDFSDDYFRKISDLYY